MVGIVKCDVWQGVHSHIAAAPAAPRGSTHTARSKMRGFSNNRLFSDGTKLRAPGIGVFWRTTERSSPFKELAEPVI